MIAPLQKADCLFLSKENQAEVGYATLAVVEAGNLIKTARDFLAAGYHLEDVSGLMTSDGAVSVYHFAHFDIPGRATVMVIAPLDKPSFPSIATVYQGAEWHERETRDFFGFNYEGNPNFIPLLLSEDMIDVHPLRKDESSLASLASFFSAQGRKREIVKQADGFTLLDVPVAQEPEPEKMSAVPTETSTEAAPAAEKPSGRATEERPKAGPAPEAPKEEKALKAETVPEAKAAPAPEKKDEPATEAKPEGNENPEPKPGPKAAPKPAPKKIQGAVKKGTAVKSGKKGAGNA